MTFDKEDLNEEHNVLIKKWVKVLRSGDYKQGRKALKRKTSEGCEHCCLGVLAELQVEDESLGVKWSDIPTGPRGDQYVILNDNGYIADGILLEEMAAAAGFGHGYNSRRVEISHPTVRKIFGNSYDDFDLDPDCPPVLTDLNDKGATFAQIADMIELEYLGGE